MPKHPLESTVVAGAHRAHRARDGARAGRDVDAGRGRAGDARRNDGAVRLGVRRLLGGGPRRQGGPLPRDMARAGRPLRRLRRREPLDGVRPRRRSARPCLDDRCARGAGARRRSIPALPRAAAAARLGLKSGGRGAHRARRPGAGGDGVLQPPDPPLVGGRPGDDDGRRPTDRHLRGTPPRGRRVRALLRSLARPAVRGQPRRAISSA